MKCGMLFEIDNTGQSAVRGVNQDGVPIIDAKSLTYNDFFQNFMVANVPCIIKGIGNTWESSRDWVKDGRPNYDYLMQKYGSYHVTVYNCLERYYNTQKPTQMDFRRYLSYLRESSKNATKLDYLKNWHLKLTDENDKFYEVPVYFASDWLNEYYVTCASHLKDDYRFVYMGPNNSWTPFHADVFMSYSWSVNIMGRKRWILFPPGKENLLKDNLGNLPYDVTTSSLLHHGHELIQEQNEAIFVPSGWHHQVYNIGDTISINHNWVNGCNIDNMYAALLAELANVEKEIADCKEMDDFEQHCQLMLKVSCGMDFYMFYDFLKCICMKRIEMLASSSARRMFHGHEIGSNHILFDLNAVSNTLGAFVQCDTVKNLDYFKTVDVKPPELLEQILLSTKKNSLKK
ncbi:unnamed protein product [Acanthoscelides obtectus]|uniref:Jumonji domain-containing protein 4 n=1 Tax=Acanthoscelides obtectus TaxID=200917 RepID=A0A9P0JU05_ACAOB|nr:unnamed protein product [Acanthoscelides obtectus]CAK1642855.1 JmjC domain-containing protein 4 [Acanthoscelides obtectus]